MKNSDNKRVYKTIKRRLTRRLSFIRRKQYFEGDLKWFSRLSPKPSLRTKQVPSNIGHNRKARKRLQRVCFSPFCFICSKTFCYSAKQHRQTFSIESISLPNDSKYK